MNFNIAGFTDPFSASGRLSTMMISSDNDAFDVARFPSSRRTQSLPLKRFSGMSCASPFDAVFETFHLTRSTPLRISAYIVPHPPPPAPTTPVAL